MYISLVLAYFLALSLLRTTAADYDNLHKHEQMTTREVFKSMDCFSLLPVEP